MSRSSAPPRCSIVIPCYGSEGTVAPLLERLDQVCAGLGLTHEVVFVNDDSPDGAGDVLDELQRRHPDHVGVVHLMRNVGQHAAIMAGLQRTRGDVVVIMDDDLQNPPEELPKLLDALGPEVDAVIAAPVHRRQAAWRNVGSRFVRKLTEVTIGKPRALVISSFKLLRREVVQAMLRSQVPFVFVDAEIFRVTRRVANARVEHHERPSGRSGYTLRKLVGLTANLVFNHSALPLHLVSAIGAVAAAGALLLALWILVRHLVGVPQQLGWPSLAVLISFLGGLTLLSLALIGRHLVRIVQETARRPQTYVRREALPARAAPADAGADAGGGPREQPQPA
ncbi:MAG TPA: glycosyltransferase family 2 protein [Polyangia bacterium]